MTIVSGWAAANELVCAWLLSEYLSGNWVAEVWGDWPHPDSLYLMLGKPFRHAHTVLSAGLEFVAVNDPHYWKSEITCGRRLARSHVHWPPPCFSSCLSRSVLQVLQVVVATLFPCFLRCRSSGYSLSFPP